MSEVDLWEGDEIILAPPPQAPQERVEATKEYTIEPIDPQDSSVHLAIRDGKIHLHSRKNLELLLKNDFKSLYIIHSEKNGPIESHVLSLGAINSYVLRYALRRFKLTISKADGAVLAEYANKITPPKAVLSENGKHILVQVPHIKSYVDTLKKVGAYKTVEGYKVSLTRVLDLEKLVESAETNLPKIEIDKKVLQLSREPIPGFDGSLESLKSISPNVLNVVKANAQSWKSLKSSKATMEEKLAKFGISNLHDLLFTLPKRFIDKSNPQELENLIEGETVSVVGAIASVTNLPNNMGVSFHITNSRGKTIQCNFWRQNWLKAKFNVGDEVLLTGRASWYRNQIQLGGSSIEHSDEAAVLPIVPVYRQSEASGVTTNFLMSCVREFLSRAGEIDLPPYLKSKGRMNYTEALTELHFPSSLQKFRQACSDLAYYELVYMQIIMQEEHSRVEVKNGIAQTGGPRQLQRKAVLGLPFKLTNSQKEGVKKMNELLAKPTPSQTLLNADVGAGKTLVAQLAALKTVESGYQAILLGPTEILATQLYNTFLKIKESLEEQGEHVEIALLKSGMKAAEKRPILAGLKDGSIDVVVGTTSVISDSVKYHNLGLIVIDEQQKFGAEQRTKMLNSRDDGLVPDLLTQSATPIPRSTAQIFYGDMECIELTEKPPGRLPIVTEWIREDPIDFSLQITNPVWSDIQEEVAKGNQAFVITPMVSDSDKIDAASVERAYKNLSQTTLRGLNVGFVHGKMKKEEQSQVMEDFRDKKYDVIVASTVVEVGVDIPDATRVVVLSADRLGASSLHQIRGRVGRNSLPSKCYLVSTGKTEASQIRLQSLVDSENGFDIALSDLLVRGEGKMFGSEQSGSSEMIFASLAKHKDWIEPARADAAEILASPYRDIAIADAHLKFESMERLF